MDTSSARAKASPAISTTLLKNVAEYLMRPLTTVWASETATFQSVTKKPPTLATTELPLGGPSFRTSNNLSSVSWMKLVTVVHGELKRSMGLSCGLWPRAGSTARSLTADVPAWAPAAAITSAVKSASATLGNTRVGAWRQFCGPMTARTAAAPSDVPVLAQAAKR